MVTRITLAQSRKVNELVRKLCCNCIKGNCKKGSRKIKDFLGRGGAVK